MKQHITKEQAIEILKLEGKAEILKFILGRKDIERASYRFIGEDGRVSSVRLPLLTIGQMIEFLGEDGMKILFDKTGRGKNEELADALWEACKDKLNQKDE